MDPVAGQAAGFFFCHEVRLAGILLWGSFPAVACFWACISPYFLQIFPLKAF